ncbi:ARL14 effector protein-like [Schistocerca gregaria]|uniref:ARL14 effector protein-like n=1 Tax=Schistocerca gregaria TaxID=7010 RepID=UPI00211E6F42|nr:ARL14 effector protein-like [Schistocerca gregaria]
MENICSLGFVSAVVCHKKSSSTEELDLIDMSSLNQADIELLKLRSTCENIECVCSSHKSLYLGTFEDRQRICCEPFKKRGQKTAKKSLKSISLTMAIKYKTLRLIQSTKLCITCPLQKLNENCELLETSPFKVTKRAQDRRPEYIRSKSRLLALKFQQIASEVQHVPVKNASKKTGSAE